LIFCALDAFAAVEKRPDVEVVKAPSEASANIFESAYKISGLPQQDFLLNQNYADGTVYAVRFKGTRGFVLEPTEAKDRQRRWVWISPLWTAFNSPTWGNSFARKYVETALENGFFVVGLDVGTTCGSPKGAQLYEEYYSWVVQKHGLNPKARMIGVSNGGLITYAWAFRHPDQVDRVLGIYPATDMRTWPGLDKIAGPGRLPPKGLGYAYKSIGELGADLDEVNPIANLKPLAQHGVKIFHLHGDKDDLVPLGPNSAEFKKKYQALGGEMQLDVFPDEAHGGNKFFDYEPATAFIVGD
jgi:dienelactone hydrolase